MTRTATARWLVVAAAGIVVMTVLAYLPAVRRAGFIWDDEDYVQENYALRSLDGLKRIWLEPGATPQYYPLVFTTFWVEYHLWGLEGTPVGYHLTNVLLHASAAVLLWLLLRRLRAPTAWAPGAWIAAAVFALHPLQVESVAWITERKNVLSAVFYFAALLAYARFAGLDVQEPGNTKAERRARRSLLWYLLALMLFAGALLSKTVTCTLPVVVLITIWWKHGLFRPFDRLTAPSHVEGLSRRGSSSGKKGRDSFSSASHCEQENRRTGDRRRATRSPLTCSPTHLLSCSAAKPLLPFFVMGAALASVTVWMERYRVGAEGKEWGFSLIDRCLIAGRAVWFYAGKLLWPARLSFIYPRWEIDSTVWWQYLFPVLAGAVIVLLWSLRRRLGRGPLSATLFFVVTLSPALGFIDYYPMRYSFVADHFQYLAGIGLIVLAVGLLGDALSAVERRVGPRSAFLAGAVGSAALLVTLGALTWQRTRVYESLEHLWGDTIAKNPDSWMVNLQWGNVLVGQGRDEEAIHHFRAVRRLRPTGPEADTNLGATYARMGRTTEAIAHYKEALRLKPDDPGAHNNLGNILADHGRLDEAIEHYRAALRIRPDLGLLHANLGAALAKQGKVQAAINEYAQAVHLVPDDTDAHLSLANLLAGHGDLAAASDHYREVVRLDPECTSAHNNLGYILAAQGHLSRATAHYREALRLDPEFAVAHNNLGVALARQGQVQQATVHFREALRIRPDYAEARQNLATALQTPSP